MLVAAHVERLQLGPVRRVAVRRTDGEVLVFAELCFVQTSDLQVRAGCGEFVQQVDDPRRPLVPADHQRAGRVRHPFHRFSDRVVDDRRSSARPVDQAVVLGQYDELIARGDDAVVRRIQLDPAVGVQETGHDAPIEAPADLAVREAGGRRVGSHVELGAGEREQVRADRGQPGLPVGLHDQPYGEVVGADQLRPASAGQLRRGQVVRVGYRRHDVRSASLPGPVAEGQQDLDHLDVRVLRRWRQHHHRAGRGQVHQVEVGRAERVAGAADHHGPAEIADPGPQRVLHLHLVHVGQDRDAGAALALVRVDELGDHGEHLLGPAEDDGVAALDDPRPALAKVSDLALQTGRHHTDEGADDEDAAERDRQHQEQEQRTALVTAHRAGVDGAQHRHPEDFRPPTVLADVTRHQPDHQQRDHQHEQRRRQPQPPDQRRRPPRHSAVKPIPSPRPPHTPLLTPTNPRTMPLPGAERGIRWSYLSSE